MLTRTVTNSVKNAAVARSVATPATLTLRLMSTAPQKVVDVQQEIAETTQRWMDAVTSGKKCAPADTAALYAKNAAFWPTVSTELRIKPQETADYFNWFAAVPGLKVVPGSYKPFIRVINDKIATNDGYFTFRADDPSSPSGEKIIKARFTFVYQRNEKGEWEIVNHHNSVMPTAPPSLKPGYAHLAPKFPLTKQQVAQLKQEVAETTQLWMDTVTSGKPSAPEDTAGLYSHDAAFWPTVSQELRVQEGEVRDYFDYFAKVPGLKVVSGSYKPFIRIINETIATNDGYFTFRADDPSSPSGEKIIPARFTFVYRKNGQGKWEVINHHNSVMPTAPPTLKPGYAHLAPKVLSKEKVAEMTQEIADTTQLWMDTVTSGKHYAPARTSSLYAHDCAFWPTVSQELRVVPGEVRDYFQYFARVPGLKVVPGSYKPFIRIINDKIATNDGYFTFKATDPSAPNGEKIIPARFTFVYRKNDQGEWEVINHHNSVMPTAPATLKPGYAYKGPDATGGDDKGFFSKLFGK